MKELAYYEEYEAIQEENGKNIRTSTLVEFEQYREKSHKKRGLF